MLLACPKTTLSLSSVKETSNCQCDDEQGYDVCPEMGYPRGGSNGIVLGNQPLAREGVEDGAVWLQG